MQTGPQASSSPFPHRMGTLVPQHDLALLSPSLGPRGLFYCPGHREGSSAPQTATTRVGVKLAAKRRGERGQGTGQVPLGAGGGEWFWGEKRFGTGSWGWQRPQARLGLWGQVAWGHLAWLVTKAWGTNSAISKPSSTAWRPRSNCSRRQPPYMNSGLMSYSCANMKETSWGGGEVTMSKGTGCEGSGSKEMRSGVDSEWKDREWWNRERRHHEWGDYKWADRERCDGEGTAREGTVSEEMVNEGTVSVGMVR